MSYSFFIASLQKMVFFFISTDIHVKMLKKKHFPFTSYCRTHPFNRQLQAGHDSGPQGIRGARRCPHESYISVRERENKYIHSVLILIISVKGITGWSDGGAGSSYSRYWELGQAPEGLPLHWDWERAFREEGTGAAKAPRLRLALHVEGKLRSLGMMQVWDGEHWRRCGERLEGMDDSLGLLDCDWGAVSRGAQWWTVWKYTCGWRPGNEWSVRCKAEALAPWERAGGWGMRDSLQRLFWLQYRLPIFSLSWVKWV